jgi:hypothetical protein
LDHNNLTELEIVVRIETERISLRNINDLDAARLHARDVHEEYIRLQRAAGLVQLAESEERRVRRGERVHPRKGIWRNLLRFGRKTL